MIECIRALGNSYKDDDKVYFGQDYDFFTNYLSKYVDFLEEDKLAENGTVDISAEDCEIFYNLMIEYEYSKEKNDKNETESLADSLAFYISTGLIIKNQAGGFKVNLSLLKKTQEKYEKAKETAITYKKGAKK